MAENSIRLAKHAVEIISNMKNSLKNYNNKQHKIITALTVKSKWIYLRSVYYHIKAREQLSAYDVAANLLFYEKLVQKFLLDLPN